MQGVSVVKTADMGGADKDLRNGTGAGLAAHLVKGFRVALAVDFGYFGYADLLKQALGHGAIRAVGAGIEGDGLHGVSNIGLSRGQLIFLQYGDKGLFYKSVGSYDFIGRIGW